MAQARVTEFFATRKKRRSEQPSKRRKVDFTETEPPTISQVSTGPVKFSNNNVKAGPTNVLPSVEIQAPDKLQQQVLESVRSTRSTRSSSRSTRQASTNCRTRQTARSRNSQKNTIPNLFENLSQKLTPIKESIPDVKSTVSEKSFAVVTDCWDEHDGCSEDAEDSGCSTPTKPSKEKNGRKRKKDQKLREVQVQELLSTPSQQASSDDTKPLHKKGAVGVKKKLVMNSRRQEKAEVSTPEADPDPVEPSDENVEDRSAEAVLQLAASMSPPKAISPLPLTPQMRRSSQRKKVPSKPTSEKILAAIEQCKSLSSDSSKEGPLIDPAVVKAKLAKCGKLEELKAQLTKMNATKAKSKTKKAKAPEPVKPESPKLKPFSSLDVEVDVASETEVKKVPAYERYHHLATPGAPTLSLPYKYRVLAEMFRGMDTVVSMLHNRSEIITFSKLKVAVQAMNKRNFELNHASQIKTVFPLGYIYRQEKGLPCYGGKVAGYQLTVEPNLHFNTNTGEEELVNAANLSTTRMTFSPTHLLQRRGYFHNRLIAIVKRYHREFLSKLSKPLSIPDEKITRWHPQFKLDEVPDVDPSPLPQPPYEKKYHTAKDVLEATRGKTLPQVERALESVAAKTENVSIKSESNNVPASKPAVIKGVPQSLLEKIRAKEAAKLQASLTRNPAEEKKTLMMNRLPDMMRIIRNYYVTEKKSTLPMENVVQKLKDSYRSSIALPDVELHVKLMVEVTPEWLSLQQVRNVRYLRLTTAMELSSVQDKVKSMVKARK